MNKIKLSEAELTQIKGYQQSFASLTIQSGKVTLALHEAKKEVNRLTNVNEEILTQFEKLSQEEVSFVNDLESRYGKGIINLAEGVFISDTNNETTQYQGNTLQEKIVTNQ